MWILEKFEFWPRLFQPMGSRSGVTRLRDSGNPRFGGNARSRF